MTTTEAPLKYTSTEEYVVPPHGFCPGCGVALALRYVLKALGEKIVMITPPGCTSPAAMRSLSHRGKPLDTIGSPFGSIAFMGSGIRASLAAQGDNETVVMGWAGDGAAFDIGFGGLSAAAERNDDIFYAVNDNEGYQNTGNQRSSASPWMSTNTTNPAGAPKMEFKKDLSLIIAAHMVPYVATATVAYPDDLMLKVAKDKAIKGFKLIHMLNPCPSGWGYSSEMTMELSRLAVDTKMFPIFEVEDGVNLTINVQPREAHITDYTKPQKRFRDMSDEDMLELERRVERRWRRLQFLASYKE